MERIEAKNSLRFGVNRNNVAAVIDDEDPTTQAIAQQIRKASSVLCLFFPGWFVGWHNDWFLALSACAPVIRTVSAPSLLVKPAAAQWLNAVVTIPRLTHNPKARIRLR